MASGHVNRVNRPNTWLHRPMLHTFKKVLANSEPSTHGGKADCIMASGHTGRTHDRTRPMLQQRQKVPARAPSDARVRPKSATGILPSRARQAIERACCLHPSIFSLIDL